MRAASTGVADSNHGENVFRSRERFQISPHVSSLDTDHYSDDFFKRAKQSHNTKDRVVHVFGYSMGSSQTSSPPVVPLYSVTRAST